MARECENCDGTGESKRGRTICPVCNGDGEIEHPEDRRERLAGLDIHRREYGERSF